MRWIGFVVCLSLVACSSRRKAEDLSNRATVAVKRDHRICTFSLGIAASRNGALTANGEVQSDDALAALAEDLRAVEGVTAVDTSRVRVNASACPGNLKVPSMQ